MLFWRARKLYSVVNSLPSLRDLIFLRFIDENGRLLGHEAVSFGNELTQFQRNLLFQSLGYSKTTFKTKAANSSETSVISTNRLCVMA